MSGGLKDIFTKPSLGFQLFKSLSGDKPQMPEPPPPAPTVDDAARAQEEADQKRRRRGVAATILSSPSGTRSSGKLGRPTLLGS